MLRHALFISRRRVYFPWDHINFIKEMLSLGFAETVVSSDLRFMHINGQVNKELGICFRPCRCCLCAVQEDKWQICFSFFFFRIFLAIIRVIFSSSCSYCWTIEIWLIIFLATDKSGKLFRGTYYSADVCFWSIRLVSILKHFFFPYCRFTTHFHHSNHAINRCWQCFFDYLECESFYQHHDKQLKLNLLDGQRCWDVRISV